MAHTGLRNIAKRRTLEDREALLGEEGDLIREPCRRKNFLSSWLWEDVEGEAEDTEKMSKKAKEEESNSICAEMITDMRKNKTKRNTFFKKNTKMKNWENEMKNMKNENKGKEAAKGYSPETAQQLPPERQISARSCQKQHSSRVRVPLWLEGPCFLVVGLCSPTDLSTSG